MGHGYLARKRRLRAASSGPALATEAFATLLRDGLAILEASPARRPARAGWAPLLACLKDARDFGVPEGTGHRIQAIVERDRATVAAVVGRAVELAGEAIERDLGRRIYSIDAWAPEELAILSRRLGWLGDDVPAGLGEVLTAALLRSGA